MKKKRRKKRNPYGNKQGWKADNETLLFFCFLKKKLSGSIFWEKGTSKADENLELLAVRSVGRGGQELLSALGELGNNCGDVLSHGLINVSLQ